MCKLFIVNQDRVVSLELEMAGRRDHNMEEFWASLPPKIKVLFKSCVLNKLENCRVFVVVLIVRVFIVKELSFSVVDGRSRCIAMPRRRSMYAHGMAGQRNQQLILC